MIAKMDFRRVVKRIFYYSAVTMLLAVVLIGSWCIPPRLLEKVLLGMKAKFQTEVVRTDGTNEDELQNRTVRFGIDTRKRR